MEVLPREILEIIYKEVKTGEIFDTCSSLQIYKKTMYQKEQYDESIILKNNISKTLQLCNWLKEKKYYLIVKLFKSLFKYKFLSFRTIAFIICSINMSKEDLKLLYTKVTYGIDSLYVKNIKAMYSGTINSISERNVVNETNTYCILRNGRIIETLIDIKDLFEQHLQINISSLDSIEVNIINDLCEKRLEQLFSLNKFSLESYNGMTETEINTQKAFIELKFMTDYEKHSTMIYCKLDKVECMRYLMYKNSLTSNKAIFRQLCYELHYELYSRYSVSVAEELNKTFYISLISKNVQYIEWYCKDIFKYGFSYTCFMSNYYIDIEFDEIILNAIKKGFKQGNEEVKTDDIFDTCSSLDVFQNYLTLLRKYLRIK